MMRQVKSSFDTAICSFELHKSCAAWEDDYILTKALTGSDSTLVSVFALEYPLRIITERGQNIIAFDYAYFLFLRSLCRAFLETGDIKGACLSLFQFAIGSQLDHAGFCDEAAGLLSSACELRSRYSVYQVTTTYEVFLYQLAINFCIAHEQTHLYFQEEINARQDWILEAESFLKQLFENLDRMYPDPIMRNDMRKAIMDFQSNGLLLEEIACDICAIDHAIEHAATLKPRHAEIYTDAYYVSTRLAVLSLGIAKILGNLATLTVEEVVNGRTEINTDQAIEGFGNFLVTLRLRFHILIMKIVSMKLRLNLIKSGNRIERFENIIETHENIFNSLFSSILVELEEAKSSNLVYPHIWIGYANKLYRDQKGEQKNDHLIALYLREFWFSHVGASLF